MDDLEQVAALLTKPGPSGGMIERGRDQLTEAIRNPARRNPARRRPGLPYPAGRRLARWTPAGWLAAGATLTAAAAAAAVLASGVVTPGGNVPISTGPPPKGTHGSRPPATHPPTVAQKILLAAAATALHQHPGTYWHFKIRINPAGHVKPPPGVTVVSTDESWIALDGKYWNAQPPCGAPGTAVFEGPGYAGYYIGKRDVNYRLTQRLPTSPAALTAWVARQGGSSAVGGGPTFVPLTLISLLWQVPAPPALRATAFEALAALPGDRSLGPVKGGVGLLIRLAGVPAADWIRLVVDPKTSLVRSEGNAKAITIIHAGWTNRLPKIVPLGGKTCSG